MQKETKYQNEAKLFLENRLEAYSGRFYPIYTEEFSDHYDDILQESSPLIGGKANSQLYQELKEKFNIIGLREKIKEFNLDNLNSFVKKYKIKESTDEILEKIFQDFKSRYEKIESEAQLFNLIFTPNQDLKANHKREIFLNNVKVSFEYNVIYYEDAKKYLGRNSFYTIRERRIPIYLHQYKKTERPDFLHYINGIPLLLVEYKTEDSGVLESIKDFEYKESYKKAPFKVALNDGRNVIFFSDIKFLKFKDGRDNSFNWVHYLPEKKYLGQREYTNIEYLFDELLCQPENMYAYCLYCSSVVNSNSHYYLINARIQQYYALKDIKKTLVNASNNNLALPYNFEFAHAQRSGKTITMKLISYMIEKSFRNIFNTIFIYTPDLQIKDVIFNELSKSGATQISVKMVETRFEYQSIIESLYRLECENSNPTSLTIYIVNMQKITDNEFQGISTSKVINSNKILNIIDEAHHGQTKETALIRQSIFPNSSNYLFTATGKEDMYLFYFPENKKEGFCNKFTISNAKECKITVPVIFLKAEKLFKISKKLQAFTLEIEKRLASDYTQEASLLDLDITQDHIEDFLEFGNKKVSLEVKKALQQETIFEKLNCITSFIDSVKEGLPFAPKAIVYVNSVEEAKKYIEFIQKTNTNNDYNGYKFGVDFSSIKEVCEKYNPGIKEPEQISANFQKNRNKENQNSKTIIDVLLAVDKYQKGFDLPSLLVTFLDTNISEPSRINQIYTRSATKYTGKTVGYCVDLTFESINQSTYQASLLLYDNPNDLKDSFIDDEALDSLKTILTTQFKSLRKELNLTEENFTSSMILQQVLNEADIKIRQARQHAFFNISKIIIINMNKMGSPLFFKPFKLELKALHDAFHEFKYIYADKLHADHHKIVIDIDSGFKEAKYITTEEIREIISQVLLFLKENNIKDIISFDYTNKHKEIGNSEESKKEIIQKFSQELKKNNIEKDMNQLGDYLQKNHKELFEMIKEMLSRISDDRTLIYQDLTQSKLSEIENKLMLVKEKIALEIKEKFNNNAFLFWSNHMANQILESFNIFQPHFVSHLSIEVEKTMKIILPQIESNLSVFDKVQLVIEIFQEKTAAKTFSIYLTDYNKSHGISSEFKEQIKLSPKADNQVFSVREDVFIQYLNQTLKQYYQNIIKD